LFSNGRAARPLDNARLELRAHAGAPFWSKSGLVYEDQLFWIEIELAKPEAPALQDI
jgi:hypothetical protein